MNVLLIFNVRTNTDSRMTEYGKSRVRDFLQKHKDEYSEAFVVTEKNFKDSYSLPQRHIEELKVKNVTVDIIGGDLDTFILATVFKLHENGVTFRILTENCFSSNGAPYFYSALKIMKCGFGNSVIEDIP